MPELLTEDPITKRAIVGPSYPHYGPVLCIPVRSDTFAFAARGDAVREARLHTFFRLGEHGRALPTTEIQFYVPDELLDKGVPTPHACRLVAWRMGWIEDERYEFGPIVGEEDRPLNVLETLGNAMADALEEFDKEADPFYHGRDHP